ncbi:hypothetical protein [Mammaliicoccus sciuri]|uniref:hypothetical protein n=1 Tax=Mammaliicoccus sciuri TaxID=1296 RepID=UPI001F186725|nr:hypothetical protein [Mammaliicoccus sciuri]MCE5086092.1 hypothetical protein [Mammaliicoccus sciuri]
MGKIINFEELKNIRKWLENYQYIEVEKELLGTKVEDSLPVNTLDIVKHLLKDSRNVNAYDFCLLFKHLLNGNISNETKSYLKEISEVGNFEEIINNDLLYKRSALYLNHGEDPYREAGTFFNKEVINSFKFMIEKPQCITNLDIKFILIGMLDSSISNNLYTYIKNIDNQVIVNINQKHYKNSVITKFLKVQTMNKIKDYLNNDLDKK